MDRAPAWFLEMTSGFNRDLPTGVRPFLAAVGGDELTFGGAAMSAVDGTPEQLAWMFQGLQDQVMEGFTGGAWPRCPVHGTHPLEPEGEGWTCPAGGRRYGYGTIAETQVPSEPARADGEVRWFSDERGWGIVAHGEGDLFVHHTHIQMPGFRTLAEGELVEYELAPHNQGRLRQVVFVRPLGRK